LSDAKLKAKIKKLFKEYLEPIGFTLNRARIPERKLIGMRQGIEFQPGTGYLNGKYILNVYWSYTHNLDQGYEFSASKRFGRCLTSQDNWFSHEEADLETEFELAEELVVKTIIPYLENYNTISKIIEFNTNGEITDTEAFGLDAGWRHYNQGFCHFMVNDKDKATYHFNEVISKHSDHPYEWVQKRKLSAIEMIALIQTT
jgi:hypothetical protein